MPRCYSLELQRRGQTLSRFCVYVNPELTLIDEANPPTTDNPAQLRGGFGIRCGPRVLIVWGVLLFEESSGRRRRWFERNPLSVTSATRTYIIICPLFPITNNSESGFQQTMGATVRYPNVLRRPLSGTTTWMQSLCNPQSEIARTRLRNRLRARRHDDPSTIRVRWL